MTEQNPGGQSEPQNNDAKLLIILDGNSPVPKYIDFQRISPFHLLAIGEWLSLKGRQMIALAEQAEMKRGVLTPDLSDDVVQQIIGVGKK